MSSALRAEKSALRGSITCIVSIEYMLYRDFFRFQTLPDFRVRVVRQGLHTEKRRCGSRQRVAASELDVGTVGELSGVADLLVDVETLQIIPHADARQRSALPRADTLSRQRVVAPRRG